MRNELKHIEEIENYLTGKMNANEKSAFEKRIREDENLASDVLLQKQIIERMQLNAFKKDLLVFHSGFESGVKSTWWSKGIYLNSFLALLVLGIAFSATYYFYFSEDKTAETKTEKTQAAEPLVAQQTTLQEEAIDIPEEKTEDESVPVTKTTVITKKTTPGGVVRSPGENKEPHYHFLMVYDTEEMEAEKGISFQTADSKSFINIPADVLVDKDGFPVKGKVQIRYREYRNAAQTAFSGIPMVYSEKGQEYNFNSAGMFEIRAFQNGEELKVKKGKSFSVDYNVTEKLDSCYFFVMDEKTKTWEKKDEIDFRKNENIAPVVNQNNIQHGFVRKRWIEGEQVIDTIMVKNNTPEMWSGMLKGKVCSAVDGVELDGVKMSLYRMNEMNREIKVDYTAMAADTGYIIQNIEPGKYSAVITCKGFSKLKVDNIIIAKNRISTLDANMRPKLKKEKMTFSKKIKNLFAKKEKVKRYSASYQLNDTVSKINEIIPVEFVKSTRVVRNGKWVNDTVNNGKNGREGTMLAEGSLDPGHTYPNLVKGLNCETFGVYNCDQIYRVPDRLAINAKYQDKKGNEIEDAHVLSMIDLKYNGAFSFSPGNFTCSKSGRNVLLLFTKNKKLYALPEDEYKKMNISASGDFTFKMNDITEKVKDPNDLKSFLGLK